MKEIYSTPSWRNPWEMSNNSKSTIPLRILKELVLHDRLSFQGRLVHIDRIIQPIFKSRKISEDLKVMETKPSLVNQQFVVYEYQCFSCDPNYIGYTSRHLHLRIEEHKYSVIGKHLKDKHNQRPTNLQEHFTI